VRKIKNKITRGGNDSITQHDRGKFGLPRSHKAGRERRDGEKGSKDTNKNKSRSKFDHRSGKAERITGSWY